MRFIVRRTTALNVHRIELKQQPIAVMHVSSLSYQLLNCLRIKPRKENNWNLFFFKIRQKNFTLIRRAFLYKRKN